MYDSWAEAVDKGQFSGVCMIDMSAAFDTVDHSLLLQKMELYGFDDGALSWVSNYLSRRSQSVCIDGSMSPPLDINIDAHLENPYIEVRRAHLKSKK